jgi:hypothetical protein
MTTSARIEGQFQVENAPYELRDRGDTECFQGSCSPERSARALVLTRGGEGDGPRAQAGTTAVVMKGGQSYTVSVKRGRTHWSGKATIQHGLIVSDACLSDAEVELLSPEFDKNRKRRTTSAVVRGRRT